MKKSQAAASWRTAASSAGCCNLVRSLPSIAFGEDSELPDSTCSRLARDRVVSRPSSQEGVTLLSDKLRSWPLPTDPCWLSGPPLVLTRTKSEGQVLFRLRDLIVQKHVKRTKDVKWTMGRNLLESVWVPWFVHFIGWSNSTRETISLSDLTQLWLGHTLVLFF